MTIENDIKVEKKRIAQEEGIPHTPHLSLETRALAAVLERHRKENRPLTMEDRRHLSKLASAEDDGS